MPEMRPGGGRAKRPPPGLSSFRPPALELGGLVAQRRAGPFSSASIALAAATWSSMLLVGG